MFEADLGNNPSEKGFAEYSWLCRYLLSIGEEPDNLLSISAYPLGLKLSQDWHDAFARLSSQSRDGIERMSYIGCDRNKQHLYLQETFFAGTQRGISQEVAERAYQEAYNAGMVYRIGNVHSHGGYTGRNFIRKLFENLHWLKPNFSSTDIFNMVRVKSYLPLNVLVQRGRVLFAFRTADTQLLETPEDPEAEKRELDLYGRLWGSGWRMNLDAAKSHQLALYSGLIGRDLEREA